MIATDAQIAVAGYHGIRKPRVVAQVCDAAGLGYAAACALLMQESSGGNNVYGSDPTQMAGYGAVTECNYAVYLWQRERGYGHQGVGPCQLTSSVYQDAADDLGGCWDPVHNMTVGFGIIANWRAGGRSWHECWVGYNGSEAYADQMDARQAQWREWLGAAA